jgi:methionyl-tRNA formyltransferase
MRGNFIFVGNRRFVLQSMIDAGLNFSSVYVVAGSHLANDIQRGLVSGIPNCCVLVRCKEELLSFLKNVSFDVLVSNGCPYILPVANLPSAHYVNIHPSCLPDLRGRDPVIGAILHKRDAGATCHIMDSGTDTGPIISFTRIPYTEDLDVTTLYQLSFVAEQRVFKEALTLGFEPQKQQHNDPEALYYSRAFTDQLITFREENRVLLQKVKAFNNSSQGCVFSVEGRFYRVFSAQRMHNPFVFELMEHFPDCVVGMSYENSIVFRKDSEVLRLMDLVATDHMPIPVGTCLIQV